MKQNEKRNEIISDANLCEIPEETQETRSNLIHDQIGQTLPIPKTLGLLALSLSLSLSHTHTHTHTHTRTHTHAHTHTHTHKHSFSLSIYIYLYKKKKELSPLFISLDYDIL